ncbi:TonB-dependent receptor [Parasphingopyxis sp. CP4]|uniref:TonB-dependent receptor plug domain-containing protein n=1 Tax=Parasphingopyxis sp. CP4 TaxID=2724527 RepID=UPI0015A43963|nr:TonB-dependent receptor [Parasphingopyxis sp. CP4]QLC22807.1 TonB-dependent receptor [Parasphingopyxis sp. CP4]
MTKLTQSVAVGALLLPIAATAQPSPDDGGATPLIVTGTRAPDPVPADQVGGSLTVIDPQALVQRQAREISDILRDVPGLAVSGIAGQTQVRIRGTEANHTLVLIDGIEVSDPFFGEFDFGSLAIDQAARIEVLRGQQSALYGSDAIGGVIHYITLSGSEAPGVQVRAEGGSFGTFNTAARYAGVAGDFDYALSATYLGTDGTVGTRGGTRDLDKTSAALSVNTRWTPAPNVRLRFVGRWSETESEFNNQDFLAGSPTFGFAVDSPGTYVENEAIYALVGGEVDLLDGRWTQAITGQLADIDRVGFSNDIENSGNEGSRLKASYVSSLRLGSERVRHTITFAGDWERERFRNTTPGGFAFTGRRQVRNFGLVAEYGLVVDERLAIGAAIRWDDNSLFDDTTSYRVHGSYAFDFGLRARAAAGSGVKNPGFFELFGFVDGRFIGNAALQPERSEGWEIGLEQELAQGVVTIGATYFESTLDDEIFTDFPPPDFLATPANRTTESRQHGVETFVRAQLGPQWRIDASYTRLSSRENSVREVRRPRNTANMAIAWTAPEERGGLTLVIRHSGSQTDNAFLDPSFVPTTVTLDAFTLVSLAGSLRIAEGVELTGRIENLFDENYEQVFSFANPGIGAFAGVRARF